MTLPIKNYINTAPDDSWLLIKIKSDLDVTIKSPFWNCYNYVTLSYTPKCTFNNPLRHVIKVQEHWSLFCKIHTYKAYLIYNGFPRWYLIDMKRMFHFGNLSWTSNFDQEKRFLPTNFWRQISWFQVHW